MSTELRKLERKIEVLVNACCAFWELARRMEVLEKARWATEN
jgi:hypothetical protein